ncbi:hypothetical protein N7466_004079 [Penicillium verhagenii]|uniref:uncharacterized protein n=1 Tax=Penicillium verhagenii TaxID=1562060 RepID=UPI002545BD25|nr:uncharacterized protein N7466_004079 [Penicillium verhagenii]KAJ5934532.1 hypothetical protein N7466_004079 [Penicillium verhagenii]
MYTKLANALRNISTNNILQGVGDTSVWRQIEEDEISRPVARKILDDREIYLSRPVPVSEGLPVLSDFGEARIVCGKAKQRGDVMPGIYRAPEVILDMEWNNKVDIWSIGVMAWDMATGGHLFYSKKEGVLNDEQHLAEMVSLMGPPPEFLRRSAKSLRYWDGKGCAFPPISSRSCLLLIGTQEIGKVLCPYRINHWKCGLSNVTLRIGSFFWLSFAGFYAGYQRCDLLRKNLHTTSF